MNALMGLAQQAFFFGGVVTALTACVITLCYPMVERRLEMLNAKTRASLTLGLCLLPVVATIAVLSSALLPSLLQLTGIGSDHCIGHEDGHQHFCLVHLPSALDSAPLTLLGILYAALLALITLRLAADMFSSRNFRKLLARYEIVDVCGPVHTLASDLPMAFSSGLFRPLIFLSTGLLTALSADEKRLLLAHEQAHLERNDGIRLLLARAFSFAHFPSTRRKLLAHLQLASEQACDAAAAAQARDPDTVAELLIKIEKLYRRHFPSTPLTLNLLGDRASTLPERVQALLAPAVPSPPPWMFAVGLMVPLMILMASHDVLHDSLEHVFNLFVHG